MSNEAPLKPVIVYVDDEPRNLAVFEAAMPDEWHAKCFDSAIVALEEIKTLKPWVIISDQRMPQMTGLQFLQIASQLLPDTQRIVVTGQTDEDVIIKLFCEAKIHDYIRKPWDSDKLVAQIRKCMDHYLAVTERQKTLSILAEKARELESTNVELKRATVELKASEMREQKLRGDIESWAPWAITEALKAGPLVFPFRRDIACLVFDIIDSYRIAEIVIDGRAARARIITMFRDIVLRHGGLTESQSGDAGYAHFGAFVNYGNPVVAALAAAREFRLRLRNFGMKTGLSVECGIALHYVCDALIDQTTLKAVLPNDSWKEEKSFETQSPQVDLVHRLEKLTHKLPGTNLLMTEEFVKRLPEKDSRIVVGGDVVVKGQRVSTTTFLLPSDLVTPEDLVAFKEYLTSASTVVMTDEDINDPNKKTA